MSKILILNTHHVAEFSPGKLSAAMVDKAQKTLEAAGHEVRTVKTAEPYDIGEQIALHQWADSVIMQIPVNWMGLPWSAKRYMDEVYSAGMGGQLSNGDGRSRKTGSHYGSGGTLGDKTYMLSLTFNAPAEAFDDPDQYLFQGKGVDDLFLPQHATFRFFGMNALETFVANDVMKNPDTDNDLVRFGDHVAAHYGKAA